MKGYLSKTKYSTKTLSQIFKELNTSQNGLSDKEAFWRLRKYGLNRLKKTKSMPAVLKFLLQFTDIMAIILMAGFGLALLMGEPRDATIIFGIVIINATIGFVQEYKAEKILAVFAKHLPSYCKVLRDGKLHKILSQKIVPGDILVLEAGDSIPADAEIIETIGLKTNEFALTGESMPQEKQTQELIFMGTSVAEGKAKAVVIKTGMETQFGQIAGASQKIKEVPTPLQKELNHAGKIILQIAIALILGTLILFALLHKDLKESLLLGIAIAVAVVPEGLPAGISVSLSLGAQRMLKHRALVKKLVHVESLGSVTVICTDKTGTLTTGELAVSKIISPDEKLLVNNMILCNNASISEHVVGDPLEVALLKFAQKKEYPLEKIKKDFSRVDEVPFNADRKMMSVVCKNKSEGFVFSKGAAPEILEHCKMSVEEKLRALKENDEIAQKGQRVLAFAHKKITGSAKAATNNAEKDLQFLGFVSFEDPPREGISKTLELCRKAAIRVLMVTGDYGLTAKAIAQKIGLANEKTRVINGEDLHKMDDEVLQNALKGEAIFARIEPEQKLRIVENLQKMKEVVAVTGDGVNDAPALVKADIGVAMGKIGTDVAKEASDMILLDDDFSSIVSAIQEGRRIFENAKKSVIYTFSANSGEFFVNVFGLLLGLPLPLLAIQVLAIDLGVDVLPLIALGVEPSEEGVMERPPRAKFERIMSGKILYRLFFNGILMSSFALLIYLLTLHSGGWHFGQTLEKLNPVYMQGTACVYATLVLCQVATAFSCKSDFVSIFKKGFFSNIWLILAEIGTFCLLIAIMYVPYVQNIFRTLAPAPFTWLLIAGVGIIFLLASEAWKKFIVMRSKQWFRYQ